MRSPFSANPGVVMLRFIPIYGPWLLPLLWVVLCAGWINPPLAAGGAPRYFVNDIDAADRAFTEIVDNTIADFKYQEWLGIRAGNYRISPFGGSTERGESMARLRLSSTETGTLESWEGGLSGIHGFGIYGDLPGGFSYQLHYGTVTSTSDNGWLRRFAGLGAPSAADIYGEDALGGSLRWDVPLEGLTLGGSLFNLQMVSDPLVHSSPFRPFPPLEPNPLATENYGTSQFWVASAEQRIGNLRLFAEYIQNRTRLDNAESDDPQQTGEGYYGSASFRFTDWFALGSHYSIYYADRSDREGSAWTARGKNAANAWIRDFGLSTQFDFGENFALRLEGHFMNGLLGLDQVSDEDWIKFNVHMTINF